MKNDEASLETWTEVENDTLNWVEMSKTAGKTPTNRFEFWTTISFPVSQSINQSIERVNAEGQKITINRNTKPSTSMRNPPQPYPSFSYIQSQKETKKDFTKSPKIEEKGLATKKECGF